jgi:hypothetical protein
MTMSHFIFPSNLMATYAQLLKKGGAMAKKRSKESPAECLQREMSTDDGALSLKLQVQATEVPPPPPEAQAMRKKSIVLRNRDPILPPHDQETHGLIQGTEFSILDDEDQEPIGRYLKLTRGPYLYSS